MMNRAARLQPPVEQILPCTVLSAAPSAGQTSGVMLYLKYAAAAVGAVLWGSGLVGQLPDLLQTAKYLGISALMLVVALL
jgi:hypothetical protein